MGEEGARVRARRERLGMDKKQLAEEAGVSRDTVAAIEEGQSFRRSSLTKIERALEAAEVESGLEPPAAEGSHQHGDLIEFRVEPDGSFIVRGPVRDRDELVQSVAELIRRARQQDDSGDSTRG